LIINENVCIQEGNLDYALNYTLLQIELYGSLGEKETVEVLKDSANHYKHVLGGELKAEEKATLSEAYHCVPSTYIDPNYQQLCKGETVVVCFEHCVIYKVYLCLESYVRFWKKCMNKLF